MKPFNLPLISIVLLGTFASTACKTVGTGASFTKDAVISENTGGVRLIWAGNNNMICVSTSPAALYQNISAGLAAGSITAQAATASLRSGSSLDGAMTMDAFKAAVSPQFAQAVAADQLFSVTATSPSYTSLLAAIQNGALQPVASSSSTCQTGLDQISQVGAGDQISAVAPLNPLAALQTPAGMTLAAQPSNDLQACNVGVVTPDVLISTAEGCIASDGLHTYRSFEGGNNGLDEGRIGQQICSAGLDPTKFLVACFYNANPPAPAPAPAPAPTDDSTNQLSDVTPQPLVVPQPFVSNDDSDANITTRTIGSINYANNPGSLAFTFAAVQAYAVSIDNSDCPDVSFVDVKVYSNQTLAPTTRLDDLTFRINPGINGGSDGATIFGLEVTTTGSGVCQLPVDLIVPN